MAVVAGRSDGGSERSPRTVPYAVALLVTVLWSSSFVLIKWGLTDIPPLYFATLRYGLAFVILLVADVALSPRGGQRAAFGGRNGALLVIAGVGGYTVAQGLQYVGLFYLPAVTTSFLLNFNPFFVLLLGVGLLKEKVTAVQLVGFGFAVLGAYLFFSERVTWGGQIFGVVMVLASGVGWAVYVVAVRFFYGSFRLSPLRLTTVTMGIGVAGLVGLTLASGEYAPLTSVGVLTVVWLASVNTALAFVLWNWTLKAIPAYEATILQDLMLIEIALFAFFFLGEPITLLMVAGMGLVIVGVVVAQLNGRPRPPRAGTVASGSGSRKPPS
ncbi:MAG: DMT family transporter [Nitrososphaerota archaeon]|nr:DMT family transporter [Nitrososphaerota archaeon]